MASEKFLQSHIVFVDEQLQIIKELARKHGKTDEWNHADHAQNELRGLSMFIGELGGWDKQMIQEARERARATMRHPETSERPKR